MPVLSRVASIWRGGVATIRKLELGVLVAGLVLTLSLLLFVRIAHEIREENSGSFDRWAVTALRNPDDPSRAWGPDWLRHLGRDITSLGSGGVLVIVVLATVVGLGVGKKYRSMVLVAGATLGGLAMNLLMKGWFARERPEYAVYAEIMGTSSFPSGHTMNAAVVYLTLGMFVARLVKRRSLQIYVFGAAVVLTLLVAFSRVYLGAHYPTDVLAGSCAGFAWATAWWLVAELLAQRAARRMGPGPTVPGDDVPAAS
jgi:undecaprenyl-diphosphatase